MGDREVPDELSKERVEKESGVALEERVFTVGEVVEYWEGAFVRGERLGSGEPAFVKRVEGKGQYAIKMVGASRGKFRICGWKSLFKDGSFNKNVARRDGARVREEARLRERGKEEAEAKFGENLRETKRELNKIEKEKKEIEKQAEYKLKKQEMGARKVEKELIVGHTRQLTVMRGDLERTRDEDIREGRQRNRQIAHELEERMKKQFVSAERERAQKEVRTLSLSLSPTLTNPNFIVVGPHHCPK